MKKITIGARGSKLSLAYVSKVKGLILESSKDTDIHVKIIKTSGDINPDVKLSEIGGKSRVSEILNRKRKLTIDMVRNLANKLNLSASLLIKDYQLTQ